MPDQTQGLGHFVSMSGERGARNESQQSTIAMRLITRITGGRASHLHGKTDTFSSQLCECRRDGEICNNLQVCPEDGVVSFFLQQSVLLAERVEFLPGLSWRLFMDCAKLRTGACANLLKRELKAEVDGVPGHLWWLLPDFPGSLSSLCFTWLPEFTGCLPAGLTS